MIVSVYKKQNMFTTAKQAQIPVIEWVAGGLTIPAAADLIVAKHKNEYVPHDTYFLVEELTGE